MLACVLALFAVPLAAYWSTIVEEFAFRDDYSNLREAHDEHGKLLNLTTMNGRPFYGSVLETSAAAVPSIEGLELLRLLGVLFIAAAAVVLFAALRSAGWNDLDSFAAALLVTLLPSAQVTASWAISWPTALALFFGAIGFVFTEAAADGARRSARRWASRPAAFAAGTLCYFIAMLTYQSNALFAAVPLAGVLLKRERVPLGADLRWLACHFAALFVGLGSGFAVTKQLFAAGYFRAAARIAFEDEPFDKLLWFVHAPLENALALFALDDTFGTGAALHTAAALGSTAAIALAVRVAFVTRDRVLGRRWAICIFALPLLAHAVLLVANDRSLGYRVMYPLAALVVVLVVFALRRLARAGVLSRAVHAAALALLVGGGALSAHHYSYSLFAAPQAREWALVRAGAALLPAGVYTSVFLITPTLADRSTKRVFADEFGSLSSDSDWAPREMFHSAVRERFGAQLPPGTTYYVSLGRRPPHPAVYDLVVDLRRLRDAAAGDVRSRQDRQPEPGRPPARSDQVL